MTQEVLPGVLTEELPLAEEHTGLAGLVQGKTTAGEANELRQCLADFRMFLAGLGLDKL